MKKNLTVLPETVAGDIQLNVQEAEPPANIFPLRCSRYSRPPKFSVPVPLPAILTRSPASTLLPSTTTIWKPPLVGEPAVTSMVRVTGYVVLGAIIAGIPLMDT